MKRVVLLLAGLTLGMTSPAWAGFRALESAGFGHQSAFMRVENDNKKDQRQDRRAERPAGGQESRQAPRQGEGRPAEGRQAEPRQADPRLANPRYGNPREGYADDPRAEARQDPRYARQAEPREAPGGPARPQARPRFNSQQAEAMVARAMPGRALNTEQVNRGGRTYYSVRWQTRDGRLVDVMVDGATGQVVGRGG